MNKFLLITGLCAFLSLAGCKSAGEAKNEEGKFSVTSPMLIDTSFNKEYVAQIQSLQNIEIRAKVSGYLESINVDEGQAVHAGQLLFTIRSNQYAAELQKAQAAVREAELEMQNAKKLAEKNIVSNSELQIAIAKLDEAKAEAAAAEVELSYTRIVAPFDGIIDRIPFKLGSLLEEGALLTSLSNNKEMYAYFNVSEVEYLNYKNSHSGNEKENVSLILANNQPHKYPGVIENIEGVFDNETGNIAFRAKFPNPDLLLKHGETGKVQLKMNLNKVLAIPQKATYELQDKIYVFVVDPKNVVHSRLITIKQKLPEIYIIESGLSESDKILIDGTQNVNDDDKIQAEYVSPKEVFSHLQLIKQ